MHWTRHSVIEAVEANPRRVPTHSPPTSHSCPEANSARQPRTSNTNDISIATVVYAPHWASLKEGCIFLERGQLQMTSGLRRGSNLQNQSYTDNSLNRVTLWLYSRVKKGK